MGLAVVLPAAAGLGAADGSGGGQADFALGLVAGGVSPDDKLPKGVIEIEILDAAGRPIAGRVVEIGRAGSDNRMHVERAISGAAGVARFRGLPTGEDSGYAAAFTHEGMRLGTDAFRMPAGSGMRGRIRALGRSGDASGLRIDRRSKIVLDVREDALAVMESLVLKNESDTVFDPGEAGLAIPLPHGAVGAQELGGGAKLEVQAGARVSLKQPIPPSRAVVLPTEARFGCMLPGGGDGKLPLRQPLPFGMEAPLILVPDSARLAIAAPGLRALPDEADAQGNAIKLYQADEIAPGGVLDLMVSGLPTRPTGGRRVALALCLALVGAAILGAWRGGGVRDRLAERREQLFADLVAVERARRSLQKPDGLLEEQHRSLVARLESVYRDLDRVERGGTSP